MLFIIYSATDEASLRSDLGMPEYSYYFVLKEFRPLLERLGRVVVVKRPEMEVDPLYDESVSKGEPCVFLSFSPPNKTSVNLRCPTIPVFAWEFDTLPDETWDEEARNDWTMVLRRLGRAIVHSRHTADVVRGQLGHDFPVVALPAPVWDRFEAIRKAHPPSPVSEAVELRIRGTVMDSRVIDFARLQTAGTAQDLSDSNELPSVQVVPRKNARYRLGATRRYASEWYREVVSDLLPPSLERRLSAALRWLIRQMQGMFNGAPHLPGMVEPEAKDEGLPASVDPVVRLSLQGVLYTSVFNPYDGRKNWLDMLTAFCSAFANEENATLVLKFTHHNSNWAFTILDDMLRKLPRFKCRVVGIHGFLEEDSYQQLIASSSFTVNTSYGEGQCLPLMEFMSCGKPAITPRHSAMQDYIDDSVAFVVNSAPELCCWPQDPRLFFRSRRHRIDWQSLCDAYKRSFHVATRQPDRYRRMATASISRLRDHASYWTITDNLKRFLDMHPKAVGLMDDQQHDDAMGNGMPADLAEPIALPEDESARCGLTDAVMSGWFNPVTGELKPGFPVLPSDVVVDVGCGAGGACHFAAKQGAEVIFCDTDSNKVVHVQEWLKRDGLDDRAHGHVTDSNPLPLDSGLATRVIAMEMLEHVDDPDQVMRELVRIGRPGALYLLSVPAEAGEQLQKDIAPDTYFQYPNHVRIFSRDEFVSLVERSGLIVEREQTYGFYWMLWMCFFWACQSASQDNKDNAATLDMITGSDHPLLKTWSATWSQLLQLPKGMGVKKTLDSYLPKNLIIIARKP